jgi:hypothetical protein
MQTIAAHGVGSDELHVMGGGPGTDNHDKATASTNLHYLWIKARKVLCF